MGELRSKATLLRHVAEILQQPLGRKPMRAPPGAARQAGPWVEVQGEAAALAANSVFKQAGGERNLLWALYAAHAELPSHEE